jgi:hypothetical protein
VLQFAAIDMPEVASIMFRAKDSAHKMAGMPPVVAGVKHFTGTDVSGVWRHTFLLDLHTQHHSIYRDVKSLTVVDWCRRSTLRHAVQGVTGPPQIPPQVRIHHQLVPEAAWKVYQAPIIQSAMFTTISDIILVPDCRHNPGRYLIRWLLHA